MTHGIDAYGDGPWSFVVPAVVNDYYSRWWWPKDAEARDTIRRAQPWTGDYRDGFGNPITIVAYSNPEGPSAGEGYGIVRVGASPERSVRFQCWPRYADPAASDEAQFDGWPVDVEIGSTK